MQLHIDKRVPQVERVVWVTFVFYFIIITTSHAISGGFGLHFWRVDAVMHGVYHG